MLFNLSPSLKASLVCYHLPIIPGVVWDRIPGSYYLDLMAACLNYLDYFNPFEVFGKDFGWLQNVQLMILSSRLNEQIEMRFVHLL